MLDFILSDGKRMTLEDCGDCLNAKLWTEGGEYMDQVEEDHVTALAFVKNKAVYQWYEDDGMSKNYENSENYGTVSIEKDGICTYEGSRKKTIDVKLL